MKFYVHCIVIIVIIVIIVMCGVLVPYCDDLCCSSAVLLLKFQKTHFLAFSRIYRNLEESTNNNAQSASRRRCKYAAQQGENSNRERETSKQQPKMRTQTVQGEPQLMNHAKVSPNKLRPLQQPTADVE